MQIEVVERRKQIDIEEQEVKCSSILLILLFLVYLLNSFKVIFRPSNLRFNAHNCVNPGFKEGEGT